MNLLLKRAKEHVWYSHDAPLVQELMDEIEHLNTRIATMGNSTKLIYDEMANSREALKTRRDTYKQRLEDAMEVLRSVAASRDEAILILENATAVAKQATTEVLQLRERVSALEFKLKSLYTVVQAEAPEILLVHDILNYNIGKLLNDN
jgi:chaperonin cofactor prefoldin